MFRLLSDKNHRNAAQHDMNADGRPERMPALPEIPHLFLSGMKLKKSSFLFCQQS